MIETKLVIEEWDVDRRLSELSLDRERLLKVRNIAVDAARSNDTNFHAANASGTQSYQNGVWALRYHYAGDEWDVCRKDGVETILNNDLLLRVGFCNVDLCCDDAFGPKPRSDKKSGSERAANLSLFESLPMHSPPPAPSNHMSLYYLMVDLNGAAELTRPVISNGTFENWVERIYLSDGNDLETEIEDFESDDQTDVFDPIVSRRA